MNGNKWYGFVLAYAKDVDPDKVEIDCYDSNESFGRGYPFREDSDELLLNLRINNISFDYENLDDFKNWLISKGYPLKEYVPRYLFGLYTHHRLKETMKINPKDTVCIIGTSLSAVDIARYLLVDRGINKLYMFSRGNIIPTLRKKEIDFEVNVMTYDKCSDIIQRTVHELIKEIY